MKKTKMSDYYYTTTVSIPVGDEEKYRLSIEENTKFIDFILDKIKGDPIEVRPKRTIGNFKIHKTHIDKYHQLQSELKKNNTSFSTIYKKYYNDFVKFLLKGSK